MESRGTGMAVRYPAGTLEEEPTVRRMREVHVVRWLGIGTCRYVPALGGRTPVTSTCCCPAECRVGTIHVTGVVTNLLPRAVIEAVPALVEMKPPILALKVPLAFIGMRCSVAIAVTHWALWFRVT